MHPSFVAPPRLELGQRDPNSLVLPLHHGAILYLVPPTGIEPVFIINNSGWWETRTPNLKIRNFLLFPIELINLFHYHNKCFMLLFNNALAYIYSIIFFWQFSMQYEIRTRVIRLRNLYPKPLDELHLLSTQGRLRSVFSTLKGWWTNQYSTWAF